MIWLLESYSSVEIISPSVYSTTQTVSFANNKYFPSHIALTSSKAIYGLVLMYYTQKLMTFINN